jgi:hypothetical protein
MPGGMWHVAVGCGCECVSGPTCPAHPAPENVVVTYSADQCPVCRRSHASAPMACTRCVTRLSKTIDGVIRIHAKVSWRVLYKGVLMSAYWPTFFNHTLCESDVDETGSPNLDYIHPVVCMAWRAVRSVLKTQSSLHPTRLSIMWTGAYIDEAVSALPVRVYTLAAVMPRVPRFVKVARRLRSVRIAMREYMIYLTDHADAAQMTLVDRKRIRRRTLYNIVSAAGLHDLLRASGHSGVPLCDLYRDTEDMVEFLDQTPHVVYHGRAYSITLPIATMAIVGQASSRQTNALSNMIATTVTDTTPKKVGVGAAAGSSTR